MDQHTYDKLYRYGEMIPGLLSWGLIFFPVLFIFINPLISIIFVILYTVLWFLRSLSFSLHLIRSFFLSRRYERIRWHTLLLHFFSRTPTPLETTDPSTLALATRTRALLPLLTGKDTPPAYEDLYHLVVIATYKEEACILRETIKTLTQAHYPLDRIIVVLACEERDKERALANSSLLKKEFSGVFARFESYLHPANIPGEIPGKGGNISYSGEHITKEIQAMGIAPEHVLVTSLDADHKVHPDYFSVLSYTYSITPNRKQKSYQPLPLFYNNIWDVPTISRLIAISSTFWNMIESGRPGKLRNFAAHAQSLDALLDMEFWARDTIVEDGHQFWRAYFRYDGDHYVIPLFIPIYQDAVQSKTYITTLKSQYLQLRRWAYGASDIPFALINMIKKGRKIPLSRNMQTFFYLIQGHILWATSAIIITFASPIQNYLSKQFDKSIVHSNLPEVLSTLFSISMMGIFVSMLISFLTLPPPPKEKALWFRLMSIVQWAFLPPITIIYGCIPALDAQTRLLFGKYLYFNVTEKIRKNM